jgi:uncharacterized protein YdhG (YjbR/CyaY superfamily)
MGNRPTTIDEYLNTVSAERRSLLEKLRLAIHSIVPGIEECISYSMPAFRIGGKVIAGFQVTTKGGSYYPFSGTTLGTLAKDVAGYDRTKSALHFDAKHPLSVTLLRKLLKTRMAELGGSLRSPAGKRGVHA